MKRGVWIMALAVGLGIFCWAFPPFRVRSLKTIRAARTSAQFNATDFVNQFWVEKLLPATEHATDASKVLEAIAADPKKVGDQYGRTVGVSSSYFLFLRGSGRVASVAPDNIGLALKPDSNSAEIVISLGLVFGNAVRDGSGLLDSSSYPNAQEFNDISAALNNVVETKVIPELQRVAAVGKRIRFAGFVEIGDEETELKPLKLVPISVELE
jgi:predicted lipoprotein